MQTFYDGNGRRGRTSSASVCLLLLLLASVAHAQEETPDSAVIYYNEACGDCTAYINAHLIDDLREVGIEKITKKDYVNNREFRKELTDRSRQLGVPPKLQGHFTTFIGGRIILEGHVPKHIIDELMQADNLVRFERIVVYQDAMGDDMDEHMSTYKVWAFAGEVKEYPLETPITEYLDWFEKNRNGMKTPFELQTSSWEGKAFISLVLVTGFLDGLNPCAFAVLLFFISFLFTIRKTRGNILKMGGIYIAAIYLAYFLIGIGLFKAIVIFKSQHAMAKVGAWLVILLGSINVLGYFIPQFPIKLAIPSFAKTTLEKWAFKATYPSAFILGFLVGLCTFPCSGGPYVAIIGLLAAKKTYLEGLMYLVLYNVMFVMPLVIILAFASNKKVTEHITRVEQSESTHMHLLSGLLMIGVGLVILIWFV